MTIKEEGSKGVADGQYNGNKEEYGDQNNVGQNVSM
jgi:hypothetical protein